MLKQMWELLVPTVHRVSGRPIRVRFHRVWDGKVRAISGGLTITKPVLGEWVSPNGDLFRDRMIPVRVIATREEIEEIVNMTLKYYEELAVLCYRISDEVILRHREDN